MPTPSASAANPTTRYETSYPAAYPPADKYEPQNNPVEPVANSPAAARGDTNRSSSRHCQTRSPASPSASPKWPLPPRGLQLLRRISKCGSEQQIFEVGMLLECFVILCRGTAHRIMHRAQQSDIAILQRPIMLLRRRLKLHKTLGIAANLRCIQRLPHGLDERSLIMNVDARSSRRWPLQDLRSPHACLFHR